MSKFMGLSPNPGKQFRNLLKQPEPILAPGAFDALSARLIEEAGFDAVYMTGFGAAASVLGRPDVGLLTMREMVDHARQIAQAVSNIPVIADADTGYGNPVNVVRTVQEYELAGVAGIHLEDQVAPKKCGHMAGKEVISTSEMAAKIRAACDARRSADFVIIARTDARAVEGLDAALARAHQYHEAGADLLFVEAPETEDEIQRIATEFPDVPLVFNWAEGGKTPSVTYADLRQLGFRLIIFPVSALLSATRAMRVVLESIRTEGTPLGVMEQLVPFHEFLDFIGLPEIRTLEARYGSDPQSPRVIAGHNEGRRNP
ncbi:isocitrate lyase/PEP mutase family protein [Sulfobacillus harzensis]|uniref:isocitrate lyase/PEP mutase family protein n=1 Tax=Sulfobacillus harzensis TaxID=2729629 RepID=UPI003083F8E5